MLVAGLALGVLAPTLHNFVLVRAAADLGMDGRERGWAQVLVVVASLAGVLGAGRAADRFGTRQVVVVSLLASCVGGAVVAVAWGPWAYGAGLVVESAAVMGAVAGYMASVPVVHLTGRLSRAVGAAFAMLAAALTVGAVLALVADEVGGWRAVEAVVPLVSAGLLLAALRVLPPSAPPASVLALPVFGAGAVVVVVAGGVLQASTLRYWRDFEMVVLLGAVLAVLAVCCRPGAVSWRGPWARRPVSGPDGPDGPGAVVWCAVVAGGVWGLAQSAVATVLLVVLSERGGGQGGSLLAWAGFGVGFTAAGLYGARRGLQERTGSALGLTLAAVGTALLSTLPHGHEGIATALAAVMAAVVGFGIVLAQVPWATRLVAALPARGRGAVAAAYPASVVLGGAAVTGIPYESVISPATRAATVHELLWITVTVLASAAVVLGRSVAPLAVAGACAALYLLVAGLSDDSYARRPASMAVFLIGGAAAGLAVWARGRRTERLARSLADAAALQEAVLRPLPARAGALEVAGLYRPATAGTGIGGDFYDVADTAFGTRILIGDVRGKGLKAVQTVADILGCFRSQAHETADLSELAARLDRHLTRCAQARGDSELFATALLLEHPGIGTALKALNCGHLPPVIIHPGRHAQETDLPAVLPLGLGALDLAAPTPTTLDLPEDATLLLYTDGLTEARDATGTFYPLTERLDGLPPVPLPALVDHLVADVEQWTYRLTDDIALITLTPTPTPTQPADA
ncbi:MFS transporter [Streptomyces sp. NPDC058486]|uniref:MFS transporter n=1 Tax=unclassified Streptomyces TaxID=2593676 RepID=UPI0036589D20